MTGSEPVVWVVANRETTTRWTAAIEASGRRAVPLPWGQPAAPEDLDRMARDARQEADLVLLTSRHASEFLPADARRGRAAACVGPGTARCAEAAGFDVRLVGRSGGRALAEQILREMPDVRRVLWLRGVDVRREAPAALRAGGVEVSEVVVYRVAPLPDFAARVREAPAPDVVTVGSPRGTDALIEAADDDRLATLRDVPFVVLGTVTARHVEQHVGARTAIAPRMDSQGLVQALDGIRIGEGGRTGGQSG